MGMVVAVAVLGRNIHCVDGHCVMGEEVLDIYLLTPGAGAHYLNVESQRGEGEKSKIKTECRFTVPVFVVAFFFLFF